MGRPQDNRLQRSGNTPLDPDHIETEVETQPHAPRDEPGGGPIPVDQQPGHHPAVEQDKPDLDAFAEKLGIDAEGDDADPSSDDVNAADDGGSAIDTVRAGAHSARELAEPVAQLVQDGVAKVSVMLDERRSLIARVERLEEQVEALSERVHAETRN